MAKLSKPKPNTATRTAAKKPPAAKIAGNSRTGQDLPRPDRPCSADLKTQVKQIIRGLAKTYPDATCALKHESAYQLIVATILSAQCTDERVNMVTPALFAKYPDVESLAKANQADVEEIIRSTGFFRAKANSLRGMAQGVVERFGGQIPKSLDDLVTLPGVGRKTANVVLGTVWGIPSGVVVDTHVKRITTLVGDHQEHVARANRARLDGTGPPIGMGQFLASADSSRPADLHCTAAEMPGLPVVELLPSRRASAALVNSNLSGPASLHSQIAAANVVAPGPGCF